MGKKYKLLNSTGEHGQSVENDCTASLFTLFGVKKVSMGIQFSIYFFINLFIYKTVVQILPKILTPIKINRFHVCCSVSHAIYIFH